MGSQSLGRARFIQTCSNGRGKEEAIINQRVTAFEHCKVEK
jgi:hypothetical protein